MWRNQMMGIFDYLQLFHNLARTIKKEFPQRRAQHVLSWISIVRPAVFIQKLILNEKIKATLIIA